MVFGLYEIIGELTRAHARTLEQTRLPSNRRLAGTINIPHRVLINRSGRIYFEYAIPRMGKRIDVVLLIGPVIFVLEFKVGESHFTSSALDQVTDYCLDLKKFHESSYDCVIAPILIATASRHASPIVCSEVSTACGSGWVESPFGMCETKRYLKSEVLSRCSARL